MQQLVAAIDLGTNTARLLIGYGDSLRNIRPVVIKRWITRLGGGFTREEGIAEEAKERTVTAMVDFAEEIKKHCVTRVRAVATSAVRDAINRKSFCDEIFTKTGVNLEIIGSKEEGLLTLQGVLAGIDDSSGCLLLFDVGGGSTEYTLALDGKPLFTDSLPLGVVRLTEAKRDPASMVEKISRELTIFKTNLENGGFLNFFKRATLVGTAGTATTLAAISMKMTDYDYKQVNNHTLTLREIREIYATLLPMTPKERLRVPGLEKGREDLIIAGTLITLSTMEMFGFSHLKVSDFGLLEGVFLNAMYPASLTFGHE